MLSALCLSDIVISVSIMCCLVLLRCSLFVRQVYSFYSVSIMCCLVLLSALCLSDIVDSFQCQYKCLSSECQ